jgi:hypothetical protein
MSRTPAIFKQADYVRAVKSARASGLAVVRSEITADGTIILVHSGEAGKPRENEFEKWKAEKNARAS